LGTAVCGIAVNLTALVNLTLINVFSLLKQDYPW
jgi:hypothetical protein